MLKLGDPLDEATDIGSIINNKQFTKVCGYVEDGLKRKDAKLVFGGLPPKEGPLSEGYFAIPTVFADTSNDWRLAREEIFGPVLVAIPWKDEAEAIRMAKTAITVSPLTSGPTTSATGCAPRMRSRAAGCRSTRAAASRPAIPTAATNRAASAANSRSKACSTALPSART